MYATASKKRSNVKTKIKNAGQKVKSYGKSYAHDITCAHDVGYALGWDHAHDIRDRFLTKTAAAYGFNKGISNKLRHDKYAKTYKKTYKKKSTKNESFGDKSTRAYAFGRAHARKLFKKKK